MAEKLALQDWIDTAKKTGSSFSEYCIDRQAKEMSITTDELLNRMQDLLTVMEESIEYGLTGVKSKGGLVGGDAERLSKFIHNNEDCNIVGSIVSNAIIKAIAVGEANAAMGRIVASPTAGSSGVLPAVLFSISEAKGFSKSQTARALATAGDIGLVIASRASLSGAQGGCQAECGSAAAMAAGAVVDMLGGTPEQVGNAVAITIKNMMGLVCDPVAGLVEVPCVKRNAGSAVQAITAAQMALAGIQSVIPVDEVIDAMNSVGNALPCSLKETAKGGIALSPTAMLWADKLFGKNNS